MVIREQRFSFNQIRQALGGVLDHDLHAKRVDSLCNATLGVLRSTSLAVCTIGQGLAAARGLNSKHATKQVDRLLSNPMINVDDILVRWVPYVIGARNAIVVALDWTDFDADKQATIMLSLISDHGRATPLVWLTVDKRTLKNNRSLYEHRVLVRLAELLPADIKVCVVADRGFGDQKLYRNAFAVVLLTLLGAAGEALGYDRMLKTNTTKRRVHSLFRQGCMLYDLIPMMPEARLHPLMQRFVAVVLEGGCIHCEPDQRRGSAVTGQQREHDGCLTISIKVGPVHGDVDAGARSHHVGDPVAQCGVDIGV
jgi:hypothetical protein